MSDQELARRFQAVAGPHLDAAYNLARWLTRSPQDAEDVVQEACLRAFRFLDGFRGGDGRAWLLAIVRNTFYSWLEKNRRHQAGREYEAAADSLDRGGPEAEQAFHGTDPERLLLRAAEQQTVEQALLRLPPEVREILVLRELEDMSYKEIAAVLGVELGTVMSRLSRARQRLRAELLGAAP